MPPEFIDLTIGTLDEKESWKRSGGFYEKVFFLSGDVPEGWVIAFAEVWANARYSPKRHARIESGQLLTICLEGEMEGEHGQFIYAAVERTNAAYRLSLSQPGGGT